jgi:hypothetical protein
MYYTNKHIALISRNKQDLFLQPIIFLSFLGLWWKLSLGYNITQKKG